MPSSFASFAALAAALLLPLQAAAEPLLGPAVGNADLLTAEGTRLYNEKVYAQARDNFLKATRVAPAALPTYLSLARAYFALQELERACLSYRVFVKSSPETPDRDKAQAELELCERQLAASGVAPQLARSFVSLKASFFEALDKGNVQGPASAEELLRSLIGAGYAAPDLGEMAGKAAQAAETFADAIHRKALVHERVPAADLHKASAHYLLALELGAAPGKQAPRAAFLEGMALLVEGKAKEAEAQFDDAAKMDPADTEARFRRALAKYAAGDKAGAVRALEADLPDDPRTGVLRVALAMEGTPSTAASELERFLFARKFKNAP